MATVHTISAHHHALEAPEPLRELGGWLIWRYETYKDDVKPRKVPYYADGGKRYGQQGSPEDRSKLTAFAAARDAAIRRGFDGVGFALLPDWGITALDFDKCVDAAGNIPPEVMAIVAQTYCEYSPSGEGVRAFMRGDLGNHKSYASADQYGFETFNTTGFVTLTNNVLPICEVMGYEDTVAPVDQAVRDLVTRRFGNTADRSAADPDDWMAGKEPKLGLSYEQMEELLASLDPGTGRDEWIRVGMALHHETGGDYDGFALWDEWSSQGGNYASTADLQTQWDSFTRRQGSGQRQITMASVMKMAKEAMMRPASTEELVAKAAEIAAMPSCTASQGVFTPEGYEGKFKVHTAAMVASREPGGWLIKGVVPKADLVVLYGASGSGKTFMALDLAAAMARGIMWRGLRTTKARVLYIAAEGGGGVGKRFEAYCRHHNINTTDLDVGIITVPPNFMDRNDITELVASITAAGGADVVIVDTYAQVTPGSNENSGEDMGLALANARALTATTGATVILIHHAGKDASKGARGWSGMRAAADAELEVFRHESGERELRISKMKDGDDGLNWWFRLEVIDVGMDRDGDMITSCVVVECDARDDKPVDNKESVKLPKLGAHERHILEIIEHNYPTDKSVPMNKLIDDCVDALPPPTDGKRDVRKQSLVRALKGLAGRGGPVGIENGMVIFYTET